jgi:hypothetical protein
MIIRKRKLFKSLGDFPYDNKTIARSSTKRTGRHLRSKASLENIGELPSMGGSHPALPAEPGTLKATLPDTPGIEKMTQKELAHPSVHQRYKLTVAETMNGLNSNDSQLLQQSSVPPLDSQQTLTNSSRKSSVRQGDGEELPRSKSLRQSNRLMEANSLAQGSGTGSPVGVMGARGKWIPTSEWISSWKTELPLQTIMSLLIVLVPQVEKMCIDKGLTEETEILKFLRRGTLAGLLPLPHPIVIRKYQANSGMTTWFRPYMWGVIYLRNVDPPIWHGTDIKLFEIQRV